MYNPMIRLGEFANKVSDGLADILNKDEARLSQKETSARSVSPNVNHKSKFKINLDGNVITS